MAPQERRHIFSPSISNSTRTAHECTRRIIHGILREDSGKYPCQISSRGTSAHSYKLSDHSMFSEIVLLPFTSSYSYHPTQISLAGQAALTVISDRHLETSLHHGRVTRRRRQRGRWSSLRVRILHPFSTYALTVPRVTDTLNQTTKGLPIVGGITEPLLDTVGGVTDGLPIVSV